MSSRVSRPPNRRQIVLLSAVAAFLMFPGVLAAAPPASADSSQDISIASGGESAGGEARYMRPPAPGVYAGLSLSPSGCVQQAHHPHKSRHVQGRINGEVRASCETQVPFMTHSAQLWHKRFWGWQRIGMAGNYAEPHSDQGAAFANDVCHAGTFRVTGRGFVSDVDGRMYFSATESGGRKDPC